MNYYVLIILAFCFNGCVSIFDSNINSSNIPGIVRASGNYGGRLAYRHKYLNNSIKALPLLMTTGKVEKTGEFFAEIDFRFYSKNKLNNFRNVQYKESIFEAIKSIPVKKNDLILITGSLYLAGEVLNLN